VRGSLEERFWAKVRKGPKCWAWTGAAQVNGYGVMRIEGKTIKAHRVSWFLQTGAWPSLNICHHCDNVRCIRPSHLFEGDQAANMSDAARKGRRSQKLTAAAVRQIRTSSGTQEEVGSRFDVTQSMVSMIRSGKVWGWLP